MLERHEAGAKRHQHANQPPHNHPSRARFALSLLLVATLLNAARSSPHLQGIWGNLKYYFDVTNTYVMKKMLRLLFPYTVKDWRRIQGSQEGQG